MPPIAPIIILPTIHKHQSVNIIKNTCNDKNNENEVTLRPVSPAKLVSINSTDLNNVYEDIEIKPEESIQRDVVTSVQNTTEEIEDTLRQANVPVNKIDNKPNNAEVETTTSIEELTTINSNDTDTDTNTTLSSVNETEYIGLYPNANYENKIINTLTFTAIPNGEKLPSKEENTWKVDRPQITTSKGYVYGYQITGTTDRSKPYASALYQNNKIDHISLTTDFFVKDTQLPPASDNNWQKFSSKKVIVNSGQFKPLAGLYYDGYLNTPIKKQEFVPKHWYNYYF